MEKYYLYEIPGVKVGVTTDFKKRQREQKEKGEMILLETYTDIYEVSEKEIELQKGKGYPVDKIPYWKTVRMGKNPKIRKIAVANTDWKKFAEKKYKSILQYSLDGKFIREWKSIKVAGNTSNIFPQSIMHCLRGRQKKAGGYIWKYKEIKTVSKTQ